ncbi:hypothetical protein V8C37DRAFT_387083 [Trichoderma ceciliae]
MGMQCGEPALHTAESLLAPLSFGTMGGAIFAFRKESFLFVFVVLLPLAGAMKKTCLVVGHFKSAVKILSWRQKRRELVLSNAH